MDRFKEKVVLFTGAGDVTFAAAQRVLDEGGKIVLADYSLKALEATFSDLTDKGYTADRILCCPCDTRKKSDCDAVVHQALNKWQRVDTLVSTAGIIRHRPIEEMTDQEWQDVIDVNLTGVFHSIQSVVPVMKKQNYGHIVVISSIGGRTGRPGVGVNYAASKAGVNGMVINLGYALAPWHITVNSIAPGPLKGRMFQSMTEEQKKALADGIPLGRVGETNDIAAAIAYLGSDDASWTTGEVLDINGGLQY